jgi:SAM-dependent methyltransferase
MTSSVTNFYDNLSPFYHLIYADWENSISRQATQLDHLIKTYWAEPVRTILDVSCGIGTQALGLAQLNYQVTGSDLSAQEIERANQEARKRGLVINFSVADMRAAFSHHQQQFDLVIACDNAIPHLLNDAEILVAFEQFFQCACPGGGVLITVRDYGREERGGTQIKPYGLRVAQGKRYFLFQVWDFEGEIYELSMYLVEDNKDGECVTHVVRTHYYAIGMAKLIELMQQAGFSEVQRLDDYFFQPVIVGKKKK